MKKIKYFMATEENEGITKEFFGNELSFDRDREYWNHFYSTSEGRLCVPSNFACFISKYLVSGKHLLELGCGNGRDSLFFLKLGLRVTGIDASDYVIEKLNHKVSNQSDAIFICEDFTNHFPKYETKYDYVYSRFTLHAISERQENKMLNNIKKYLANDGLFFIEARTVHDSLYGKGINVNKNAYIYDNHYRRFIDVDEFKQKLEWLNFKILFLNEQTGFSKTDSSDPVLMRCIVCINV